MKKYRHTRRSAILYLLLTPLTLLIYPMVVWAHVRKEVNQMYEGKEGYKKSMPFIGVFFLGIITLGIVPIVWTCKISKKVGAMAYELGIKKPHISGASFFFLVFFFAAFIIPYIVGIVKFLHTVNAVEKALNEKEALEAKPDEVAPAEEEPKQLPAEAAPIEKEEESAEKKEEKPEEAKAEEQPAEEEKPAEEPKQEQPKEPAEEPKEEQPRWFVRYANDDRPVKYFKTREEALAYAKGLAARKKATLRIVRKLD